MQDFDPAELDVAMLLAIDRPKALTRSIFASEAAGYGLPLPVDALGDIQPQSCPKVSRGLRRCRRRECH
ncbi:MAG: hypothetical protein F6K28_60000 [Microcoleus sp. SIO2G3]|nr:hypothetical protein [Microcoleus sp. SIO2G3]